MIEDKEFDETVTPIHEDIDDEEDDEYSDIDELIEEGIVERG